MASVFLAAKILVLSKGEESVCLHCVLQCLDWSKILVFFKGNLRLVSLAIFETSSNKK
jgi:hypothetical protein